ncbi:hypothetical protein ACXR0O_08415 [Verrucomicrobiota bacterium sgz303538]
MSQRKLKEAEAHEITAARATEALFSEGKATSPDGRFLVTFHLGKLLRADGQNTTTSYYSVETRSGKVLARVQSTLSAELNKEFGYKQKVWFTRDGQVLIYETWSDGAASHDTTALVSCVPDGMQCVVRYLALPTFTGYLGVEEHGAVPVGIVGDQMLFDPLVSETIYKIPLGAIQEAAHPLPFTTG